MKLSDSPSRSNNLQLLRFLAALLVIVSHAFALSTGKEDSDLLIIYTNGQLSLGALAVSIFFCAGGYLIAKSLDRVKDGIVFFKNRIIRIFPSLIVVVLLSAFVLGPFVTQYEITTYFKHPQVYKYLLNACLILQHNLPGVFLNNPYAPTVNGSLWTLPVEFCCYIACYFMWKMKFFTTKNGKYSIPLVLLGILVLKYIVNYTGLEILLSLIRPATLFYVGILYYIYRDKIYFSTNKLLLNIILLFLSGILNILNIGMLLFFPYILLHISFACAQIPDKIGNWGNSSYCIYLCAFPIQQILVNCYSGQMTPIQNMVYAIPLSVILGYLLYRGVEKPSVKLGQKHLM